MARLNFRYEEPMEDAEFSFLQQKATKEKRTLYRVMRTLSFVAVAIASIGITFESLKRAQLSQAMREIENREDPYFVRNYLIAMLVLLLVVTVSGLIFYRRSLWKLKRDMKRNLKSVEEVTINRKQFIETNGSYHFFIDSRTRLSIEVNKADFEKHEEGDQINIEYSTYSNIYFGYF